MIENAAGSDNEKSGSNAEKTRKGGDKEKPAASYKEKHPTGIPSSSSSSNKYGFYQSSCSCYGFAVAQNKETNKSLGERENQGQKQDTCWRDWSTQAKGPSSLNCAETKQESRDVCCAHLEFHVNKSSIWDNSLLKVKGYPAWFEGDVFELVAEETHASGPLAASSPFGIKHCNSCALRFTGPRPGHSGAGPLLQCPAKMLVTTGEVGFRHFSSAKPGRRGPPLAIATVSAVVCRTYEDVFEPHNTVKEFSAHYHRKEECMTRLPLNCLSLCTFLIGHLHVELGRGVCTRGAA